MTAQEFLAELQDIMQRDEALSFDTILKDLDEWDSLSVLGVAAFLDRCYGIQVTSEVLKQMKSVRDIATAAGLHE